MKPIVRIPLLVLITAVALSLGMVGVHAATQCVRFVKTKALHHKVSAATAARWAAWNKAHPNWHPKKKPEETMAQLDFACAVSVTEKPADTELPQIDLVAFDFAAMVPFLPRVDDEEPSVLAMNEPPQSLYPDGPLNSFVTPPVFSPQYPSLFGSFPPPPPPGHSVGPAGVTPEPSTWMLLGTSMLAMIALATRRTRPARLTARA